MNVHAASMVVVRNMDGANPQPLQTFQPARRIFILACSGGNELNPRRGPKAVPTPYP